MLQITQSRTQFCVFVFGLIGMLSLAGGSLFLGLYDTIIRFFMERKLMLKPGCEFFDIWKELPVPPFQRVYMFNITNPESFSKYGSKPIIQELGPYVFRGKWKKENIHWNDEAGTVTYKDVKDYTFAPDLSKGSLEDKIYTLNGPLLTVINYFEEYTPSLFKPIVAQVANGIFEAYNESLLVHRTVREMLYEGYHEPMVEDLTKVVDPFISLPIKLINNTFGILHERRILGDGTFTVDTGENGLKNFSDIAKWNNQTMIDWWNDPYCDQINGTDGAQFPPGILRNDVLFFFNPNLCRSLSLVYKKDVTVHGIAAYRFAVKSDAMSSPAINPDNQCFCTGHKCHISGILPYNCKKGTPYVISHPHFFEADPELQNSLVGIRPSADKHTTFFDVEPITGIVLNAAIKLQLSGVVRRNSDYTPLKHVGESIVPVLWLSEEATLNSFFADYYKKTAQTPMLLFKAFCITSIALGALWTVSAAFFIFCMRGKVKPLQMKSSLVMNTLQSVYTSVALWPPAEDEPKENQRFKTHL